MKYYQPENLAEQTIEYEFSEILADAFSYSMSIDKIHIGFYLYKVYRDDVFMSKGLCIESLISTFKDQHYKKCNAVPYIEERLYMLEILIFDITYPQALDLLNTLSDLMDLSEFKEEEKEKYPLSKLLQDKISQSFLTYCVNPLKIIVMIINTIQTISDTFPMLVFKTQELKATILLIGNAIIEETAAGDDIMLMVEDKLYNQLTVVDMIAYLDITELLQSPVMDNIVSSYWEGPYEKKYFFNDSTMFQTIKTVYETLGSSGNFGNSANAVKNPNHGNPYITG